jgi:uncharacterized protein YkwD
MTRLFPVLVASATLAAVRAGDLTLSPTDKTLLELTNAERKKKDLPPLKPNALLFKVAQAHAENMAKQGKMEHNLDGMTPLQRLQAAGYKYYRAYENIAMADANVPLETLMKAWMDSKGHRENILNDICMEIGLGVAKDKDGQVYYTQLFAKQK